MMIDRAKVAGVIQNGKASTGIQGLDELLQGGFPRHARILVSGGTGTGETIFCLQYLVNGAVKNAERGVYVSFEEPLQEVRKNVSSFGWNLSKMEKEGEHLD